MYFGMYLVIILLPLFMLYIFFLIYLRTSGHSKGDLYLIACTTVWPCKPRAMSYVTPGLVVLQNNSGK